MRCSKCNGVFEDNYVFCPLCGAKVEEEREEHIERHYEPQPQEEHTENRYEPQEEQEEITVDLNPEQEPEQVEVEEPALKEVTNIEHKTTEEVTKKEVQQEEVVTRVVERVVEKPAKEKKKRKHSVISIGLIIIIILAILIAFFAVTLKGPERMYESLIRKYIKGAYGNDIFTARSANINASVDIATDIYDVSSIDGFKDIMDIFNNVGIYNINSLNGFKGSVGLQYDLDTKQAVAELNINKSGQDVINGKTMVDLSKDEVFVYEPSIYEKTIRMDIPEDKKDEINYYIEHYLSEYMAMAVGAQPKAARKIYGAINSNLSKKYYTSQKVIVNIKGTEKKVKDSILTISYKDLGEVIRNAARQLRLDNEFLTLYSNKDKAIEVLDYVEDYADNFNEDVTLSVHYYTSGLLNDFVGFVIVAKDEFSNEKITEFIKVSNKEYELNKKESMSGYIYDISSAKITVNKDTKTKKSYTLELNVQGSGKLKANFELSQQYNKGIVELNTEDVKDSSELTPEDFQQIYGNLYTSDFSDLAGFIFGNVIYRPKNYNLEEGQSAIETYDEDVITFYVPTSFEREFYGVTSERFHKSNLNKVAYVEVYSVKSTDEDYGKKIDSYVKKYTKEDGYTKVKVSDAEKYKVNDKTFYSKKFSYVYTVGKTSTKTEKTYYYTSILDDYVYCVEISDTSNIVSKSEIEKLLTVGLLQVAPEETEEPEQNEEPKTEQSEEKDQKTEQDKEQAKEQEK